MHGTLLCRCELELGTTGIMPGLCCRKRYGRDGDTFTKEARAILWMWPVGRGLAAWYLHFSGEVSLRLGCIPPSQTYKHRAHQHPRRTITSLHLMAHCGADTLRMRGDCEPPNTMGWHIHADAAPCRVSQALCVSYLETGRDRATKLNAVHVLIQ